LVFGVRVVEPRMNADICPSGFGASCRFEVGTRMNTGKKG